MQQPVSMTPIPPATLETGKAFPIASRFLATTLYIPLVYEVIETAGYYASGDRGGAQYKRVAVEPSHAGKFQDAGGAWFEMVLSETVNLRAFGAKGDGVTDDRAALLNAITFANGATIHASKGDYVISAKISVTVGPMVHGIFAPGPKINGDGIDVTTFRYSGTDGYMLEITVADFNTQKVMNSIFTNFTIRTHGGASSNNGGIKCSACYMLVFDHLRISGLKGDGINVVSTVTDTDGCTWSTISNCFIENCTGWGINAGSVATGNVSLGFLKVIQCWVQGCGVDSAASIPPSGGMCWKGLIMVMDGCGFTLNQNVGLFIPGRATNATIRDCDFENQYKRAIYVRGITNFYYTGGEFLSAVPFPTYSFLEFDATDYAVKNVLIENVSVRAYDGYPTPTTAFKLAGTAGNIDFTSCRIRNIFWLDFDYAGQKRIEGFQFDQAPDLNVLTLVNANAITYGPAQIGMGSQTNIRRRGPAAQSAGGVASNTGEWVHANVNTAGIQALAPGTGGAAMRYIYIMDNGGLNPVPILSSDTVAPVLDATTGYLLHATDKSMRYVGRWATDAAGLWIASATGWFNPNRVPGPTSLNYIWRSAAGLRMSPTLPTSDTDGTLV